jgi:hypothetical protein
MELSVSGTGAESFNGRWIPVVNVKFEEHAANQQWHKEGDETRMLVFWDRVSTPHWGICSSSGLGYYENKQAYNGGVPPKDGWKLCVGANSFQIWMDSSSEQIKEPGPVIEQV